MINTTVTKRDGSIQTFDASKIYNAIGKTFKAVYYDDKSKEVTDATNKVVNYIDNVLVENSDKTGISIEAIQNIVENILMNEDPTVAKAYIIYREKRSIARNADLYGKIQSIINAESNDITKENANMNSETPAGMMMKFATLLSKSFAMDVLLSQEAKDAVNNNILHEHDLDYMTTKSLTCIQHPSDIMLENGFDTGTAPTRGAKRIESAAHVVAVIMQDVQNEMHGGQSIPLFDFYMAPFVRASYIEEIKKIEKYADDDFSSLYNEKVDEYIVKHLKGLKGEARVKQMAVNETTNRVHQSMEAFIHNMNTMKSRGGNQTVFSSINYGCDTSAEGRCVIRELLNATYKGVGDGRTAIFPIQIFQSLSGVSYLKSDRNHDLYKLACKVTARRFFPTFLNLDAPFNKPKFFIPETGAGNENLVAVMGCVEKNEVITYRTNNKVFVESFERAYDRLSTTFDELTHGKSKYLNTNDSVEIYDSYSNGFVNCKKFIKNPNQHNWYHLKFNGGRSIVLTKDHPLPVMGRGRTKVEDLQIGDEIYATYNYSNIVDSHDLEKSMDLNFAWLLGVLICDGCISDANPVISIGFNEIELKDDIVDACEYIGFKCDIKEQHRGKKGDYIDIRIRGIVPKYTGAYNTFGSFLREYFGGTKKINRSIPSEIFNSIDEIKQAFLSGMIDADGYCSRKDDHTSMYIGSTNKELAIQQMMLIENLGYPARIYENHYSKKDPEKIRYAVNFESGTDSVKCCSLYKKRKLNKTSMIFDIKDNIKLVSIEEIDVDSHGYDVETSSDHFDVSGINSHNCRTRVYENRFGESTSIGRGNLSFSTINIVRLAFLTKRECGENATINELIHVFMKKLDDAMDITSRQLYDRYKFQCTAKVSQFPLLMRGMWKGSENLTQNDTVKSVLKHGTLSIGYIGLAEALIVLTGKHHGESDESQKIGVEIVSHMRQRTSEYSDAYDLNYSLLATPAEGLSGKFVKKDAKEFGIIEHVTDKEYYTNSSHIPVWYKCSVEHKAEIEAPYHALCNAGHIFYVELDGDATHNEACISQTVDLMKKYNISYGAQNHVRTRCMNCGQEFSEKVDNCPKCGADKSQFDTIERITGYLVGNTSSWNAGKKAELHDRVTHGF